MMMLKRRFFAAVLLAFGVALTAGATPGEVPVGGVLRDVAMEGMYYGQKRLSEYRGKPLVINVWASWCGPCRAEMDSLQGLSRRLQGKVQVIGISTDDDKAAAQAFLKRTSVVFSNFIDRNVVLENMLGADRIPLTLLVDADGRVVRKVAGSRAWDSQESVEMVSRALKVRP